MNVNEFWWFWNLPLFTHCIVTAALLFSTWFGCLDRRAKHNTQNSLHMASWCCFVQCYKTVYLYITVEWERVKLGVRIFIVCRCFGVFIFRFRVLFGCALVHHFAQNAFSLCCVCVWYGIWKTFCYCSCCLSVCLWKTYHGGKCTLAKSNRLKLLLTRLPVWFEEIPVLLEKAMQTHMSIK